MARAGPRKVQAYSREFKLTAVRLSQQPGIQVQAVAAELSARARPPGWLILRVDPDTQVPVADNKTKPTRASVADYIASRANARQRGDCRQLMALFRRVTHHSPRMWGPSIVGYGSFRYTYQSGRTGEMPLAAFAIRGPDLVVYLMADKAKHHALLSRLGKHKMGKSCLYFRQLADIDASVLEQLVVNAMAEVRRLYG